MPHSHPIPLQPAAYEGMLDLVREAVVQTDMAGTFLYVNPGWERLTGLTRDESHRWKRLLGLGTLRTVRRIFAGAAADVSGSVHQVMLKGDDPKGRKRRLKLMVRHVKASETVPATFVATISDETSCQRLEQELDVAHTRFESTADIVPVGIYRVGVDGRITYFNRRWYDWLGPLAEGAIGRHWADLALEVPDFRRDPPFQNYTSDLPERERIVPVPQLDGGLRLLHSFNRAEFDLDGKPTGFVGVAIDVTEQIASQKALADSERAYSMLADQIPCGVFRTDPNGFLTFVNSTYTQITGLSLDQSQGEGWRDHAHPDDVEDFAELWAEILRTGQSGERKVRWLREDGSVVVTEVYASAETDENDKVLGFVGVFIDVTERDAYRSELQRREAEFSLLVENSSDAIFRITLDGICLFASPAVREQLGMSPESLIGRRLLDPLHPDDRVRVLSQFEQLVRGQTEMLKAEYRTATHVQPDVYIWLEASCRLVRDEEGAPSEVIANIRDVTRRKELVARLHRARQAAEDAARSRSVFLANMSHEIRTPMNGVLGFADLLKDTDLDHDQALLVDTIRQSGNAMMTLLDDILDLSRIEAGKLSLRSGPVDLRDILAEVARLTGTLLNDRPIRLVVKVEDNVPACVAVDQSRLRQILVNLMNNATKFTEEGEIGLRVRVGSAGMLEFSVSDTGIGISKDAQGRVFNMFEQAGYDTHRQFGGTGLGLAICRNLAELMGGSLALKSEEGVGSTFTLALPLVVARPGDAQKPAAPRRRMTDARVLVAEDNETNRLLIRLMLQRVGIDPVIVEDGRQAVEAVMAANSQGPAFDLVLMDVEMPVLDGTAATREIRGAGISGDDLPIVALTAHAFAEDERKCLEAGMQAHMTKPIQPEAIESLVMPLIRQRVVSAADSKS